MKKLFAAAIAAMILAVSAMPVFASVDSPVATTVPESTTIEETIHRDDSPESPKTGASDIAAFGALGLTLAAAGVAVGATVKAKKK